MILGVLARSLARVAGWLGMFPTVTIRDGVAKGMRIGLKNADRDYVSGVKEAPVQAALARHIRAGDVVFDIGSNIGFVTLIAARLVGDAGQIYAFEPLPDNVACLRRNLQANGIRNCTVYELALGDHAGAADLLLSKHSGGNTIAPEDRPPDFSGTLPIRVETADDLVRSGKVKPPEFVKIDVEGAEMRVLRGMTSVIGTYQPTILFEVDDADERNLERKFSEIRQYLERLGYDISRIEDAYPGIDWCVVHGLALPQRDGSDG